MRLHHQFPMLDKIGVTLLVILSGCCGAQAQSREQELRLPSVCMDGAAAEGATARPKVGALAVLPGAADEPPVAVPAKLKPLKAPVAGVLATAAGALPAALAAPEPKEKPGELGGTGAAARCGTVQS